MNEEEELKVKGVGNYGSRYHCSFDGRCFCIPSEEMGDLEWRLRYQPSAVSRSDQLVLAGLISSYRALTSYSQKDRNYVFGKIKKAVELKRKLNDD